LPQALPTRYVPPSGFGYPPGGLLPSIPSRFSFTPTALLGFTLRSFLLLKGILCITTRINPRTVSPADHHIAGAMGRPQRAAVSGFKPSKSPWRTLMVLAWHSLDAPLGFTLPRHALESLNRVLTRPPPTRFCDSKTTGAPEYPSAFICLHPTLTG